MKMLIQNYRLFHLETSNVGLINVGKHEDLSLIHQQNNGNQHSSDTFHARQKCIHFFICFQLEII